MTPEQFQKLDNCYFKYSLDDLCIEEIVEARTFLGAHRFDFYAILFYIDQKVKGVTDLSFAKEIYKERTRAMTGFKLAEIGNDNKSSFDDFLDVLDQLIDDFQNGNYDYEKTLIPIDKKGEPIDGAHRVSCAAYFNKKIKVLRFLDREITSYNYEYLNHELLPRNIGDIMALEALKWHDNVYALFLWPKAYRKRDKFQEALHVIYSQTDILYQTEYKLSFEAKFQKLSPGGAISYVEVPNMQNNIPAVLALMKHIYNNIMYAELNTKSDYCQECGYTGEIQIVEDEHHKLIWECPNCHNRNQETMNVARRTCGYIGTQYWNQGRTQEIKERVLHL